VELCPCCPIVPVVSKQLATAVLPAKDKPVRERCLARAFAWLTERHEGLAIYEGIHARPYSNDERNAIATETGTVSGLPCPFFEADGCALGGLGPGYNQHEEFLRGQPYGWLPTWVASIYDQDGYRELQKRHQIADAKTAGLARNKAFIYKDDHGNVLVG
jgi:hypothetical protein